MTRLLRGIVLLDRSPQSLRGRVDAGSLVGPSRSAAEAVGPVAAAPVDGVHQSAAGGVSDELRALLSALEESVLEVEQLRRQSLEEFQHLAVELAVVIAGELVFRAIEANEFGVAGLVSAAIQRLGLDAPITITLHPQDLQLLQSQPASEPAVWRTGPVTLRADAALPRGHCRAASGTTTVLSEWALRLEEIRESLWEGLDDAQVERRQAAGIGSRLRRFPDRRETA